MVPHSINEYFKEEKILALFEYVLNLDVGMLHHAC